MKLFVGGIGVVVMRNCFMTLREVVLELLRDCLASRDRIELGQDWEKNNKRHMNTEIMKSDLRICARVP